VCAPWGAPHDDGCGVDSDMPLTSVRKVRTSLLT
jgi:hypothetical protein